MWNKSQIAALEALKIPRYEWLGGSTAPITVQDAPEVGASKELANETSTKISSENPEGSVSTQITSDTTSSESSVETTKGLDTQPTLALYQLGPWLLRFPASLPVGNYPWLMDLSKYIESRPTLVSSAGDKAVIDCTPYAKDLLTPDEKKALWRILKPALRS